LPSRTNHRRWEPQFRPSGFPSPTFVWRLRGFKVLNTTDQLRLGTRCHITRNCDGSQEANNRDDDHDFYQSECGIRRCFYPHVETASAAPLRRFTAMVSTVAGEKFRCFRTDTAVGQSSRCDCSAAPLTGDGWRAHASIEGPPVYMGRFGTGWVC
jgi:hypothetical protein